MLSEHALWWSLGLGHLYWMAGMKPSQVKPESTSPEPVHIAYLVYQSYAHLLRLGAQLCTYQLAPSFISE